MEKASVMQRVTLVCLNAKVAFLLTPENLFGCQKLAVSIWNMFCHELKTRVVYH